MPVHLVPYWLALASFRLKATAASCWTTPHAQPVNRLPSILKLYPVICFFGHLFTRQLTRQPSTRLRGYGFLYLLYGVTAHTHAHTGNTDSSLTTASAARSARAGLLRFRCLEGELSLARWTLHAQRWLFAANPPLGAYIVSFFVIFGFITTTAFLCLFLASRSCLVLMAWGKYGRGRRRPGEGRLGQGLGVVWLFQHGPAGERGSDRMRERRGRPRVLE